MDISIIVVLLIISFVLYQILLQQTQEPFINISQSELTQLISKQDNHIKTRINNPPTQIVVPNIDNSTDNKFQLPPPPDQKTICYQSNESNVGKTFDLDSCLMSKMSNIDDTKDYANIISDLKKLYQQRLDNTYKTVYNREADVKDRLDELKRQVNKYGMETISKSYYDTIYQYGDFEEVTPYITSQSESDLTTPTALLGSNVPEELLSEN